MIDLERIRRARVLISLVDAEGKDVIVTRFGSLQAELSDRAAALRVLKKENPSFERIKNLSVRVNYTGIRLTDIFARLRYLEWTRQQVIKALEDDPSIGNQFAQFGITTDFPLIWNTFAGLAIKDFHIDISSVMDSVGPLLIQVQGQIRDRDLERLPGFHTVQSPNGSYREQVPNDLLDVFDLTERWWPTVKKVRDVVTHREHHRLVFGRPSDGVLFQVYEGIDEPMIDDVQLMYREGKNVVDFSVYCAFVIAELLVFLDDLAELIAGHIGIQSAVPSMIMGSFKALASSLDKLLNQVNNHVEISESSEENS